MSGRGNFESRLNALEREGGHDLPPFLFTFDSKIKPAIHWYWAHCDGVNFGPDCIRLNDNELARMFPNGVPDHVVRRIHQWATAK
jgi:hypothetical protein